MCVRVHHRPSYYYTTQWNHENKSKVWVQSSCFYWPCQINTINSALKIHSDTQLQQVQTQCYDSHSANIFSVSIKSVWLNNSSKFHLSVYSFMFKFPWNSWTDNLSTVTCCDLLTLLLPKQSETAGYPENPQSSSVQNQMCPNSELRLLPTLPPCDAIDVYTLYIHCPSCMHMCFWVVLNETRVQSVL